MEYLFIVFFFPYFFNDYIGISEDLNIKVFVCKNTYS
jgi:hypothetical protein